MTPITLLFYVRRNNMIIYLLIGIIGGFLSGFMGIGGGIIMVPFMVFLAGFSQHLAQGTSLAVLSIPIVIFGAYQYYTHGNVDIKAALIIAVMFCVGIFLGSKFAHTFSSDSLKIIFGFLMVIIGMKMIVN